MCYRPIAYYRSSTQVSPWIPGALSPLSPLTKERFGDGRPLIVRLGRQILATKRLGTKIILV